MNNINPKPFLFILIVFSGLVWFGLATASGLNMQHFVDFMRPIPKVVTADLLLVAIFMKWLWRWKIFQGWLVPFPDLNGTWKGNIQTNWKDSEGRTPGPIPAILTIKQTFGRLSCVMRTHEMESILGQPPRQIQYYHKQQTKFPHPVGIVIGRDVLLGKNCCIYQNVTIGGNHGYPILEDNVTVLAGAVLIGNITIGKNSIIGSNTVITRDVPANVLVGGFPAKIIKYL